MMNHHMQHGQMNSHPHHPSRRQQEFAQYHHHHQQQPMHHNPYGYPHPAYYQNQPPQFPTARWQNPYQQPPYMPHGPPMPQPPPQISHHPQQFQPRSPMVVSSTPYNQPMPHLTRQHSNHMQQYPMHNTQSPRPHSQHLMQHQQLPPQAQPPSQNYSHPQHLQQGPTFQQQHQHQQQQQQQAQQDYQQYPPPPPAQQQQQQPPLQNPATIPSPPPTPKEEQASEQASEQTPVQQPAVAAAVPQEETPSRRQATFQNPLDLPPEHKTPFYPTLPWYSGDGGAAAFPRRQLARRRRRQELIQPSESVALPARKVSEEQIRTAAAEEHRPDESIIAGEKSDAETLATSQAPSEQATSENGLAPSLSSITATAGSTAAPIPTAQTPPSQMQQTRRDTRTAVAVPNIPALPKQRTSPSAADRAETRSIPTAEAAAPPQEETPADAAVAEPEVPKSPAPAPKPKSWADLVRRNAPPNSTGSAGAGLSTTGLSLPKSASLADALRQYNVDNDHKLSFLEPRGLVNTGNMCYMNSILQVLVFCSPFYNFLDQVRARTVHSMKSETPLVDAMIMFMKEFKVLASADSVDVLRMLLPQQQLEQYGEPVTPEYVYDAIRKLDRFISMRRGHQQDAEEFLGFLLEGLHDECVAVMSRQSEEALLENEVTSPTSVKSPTSGDGWLEVGPKQKASITRHAGSQDTPSPITKIFGGHLRSELRVQGLKDSVTLEPYKPLQLDIGASNVNNIIDALKGLTRSEVLTGDFGGRTNTARKQVFIDTLPPILVLHLKRFQYDLAGTQKIWKKVGYPLELEIPKEVLAPNKRAALTLNGGLPQYRLTAVVYHHGKSAAGGHYTVDILRADGREWVRMDDTVIRRIRPEDVAEGGAEEDPKILARALEQHKADQDLQKQRNIFQGLDDDGNDEDGGFDGEERPWSEVNGGAAGNGSGPPSAVPNHKKWSSIATSNGSATPASSTTGKRTPTAHGQAARKEGVRDNKVAYILLYERMSQ